MLVLLNLLLLLRGLPNTYAAVTSANATSTEQYVACQSQPNERGTWDILTSCVLTMSLCIWTALHLNIPMNNNDLAKEPRLRWRIYHSKLGRQARWIIMGLVAPELVVYTAWQQRREVKAITAMAQKAQERARASGDVLAFDWIESHSWYLVMGGFYFDTNTKEPYIPDSPNLILTSEAVYLMTSTSPPLLPEIAEDAIKDRSKADKITKCLAALQAIYQFAQCATRWRGGLAVYELELNTSGHILCALAIYFCWFRKLKDVKIRTRIDTRWSDPLCAYLCMCMSGSFWPRSSPPDIAQLFPIMENLHRPQAGPVVDAEEDATSEYEKTLANLDNDHIASKGVPIPTQNSNILGPSKVFMKFHASLPEKMTFDKKTAQPLDLIIKSSKKRNFSCLLDEEHRLSPMVDTKLFKDMIRPILKKAFRPAALNTQDDASLACVNLALQYFSFWSDHVVTSTVEYPKAPVQTEKGIRPRRDWTMPPYAERGLTTDSIENWPHLSTSRTWHFGLVFPAAMIALLTACYGGIHASAWFYHFPTAVEAVLWRVSSIIVASSGILVMLDRVTVATSSYFTDRIVCRASDAGQPWVGYQARDAMWLPSWLRVLARPFASWRRHVLEYVNSLAGHHYAPGKATHHSMLVKLPVCLCLALFVAARMFVVVEAFISLRSLPTGAYETPNWSQWFIHL